MMTQDSKINYNQQCWHDQSVEQVLSQFNSSLSGLTYDEAELRLQISGPNTLPKTKKRSALLRFLLQFNNILIYVLLAGAVITALLHHMTDTFVILSVVVVNALIGFIQEGKAQNALDALSKMLAPNATVLRDGVRFNVDGETLVPGDIVFLEPGDKVPADLRLVNTYGLTIQEAILTGESLSVEKSTNRVNRNCVLGDQFCMAFSGTLVTNGQGSGVVIATGQATQIGRISNLLSNITTLTTPLTVQMEQFAKMLTAMILLIAGILLVYGYFVQHYDFIYLFMAVVGLSVAAIPEGLPAVLSITLAIGVRAMARRNVIVRRLPAIEALGSVSVICTDKTGTLTLNEMAVICAVTAVDTFRIEGTGYEPKGTIKLNEDAIDAKSFSPLLELGQAAAFCNDAALHAHERSWIVDGDPMEGALLAFAGKINPLYQEERDIWTRIDVIPFDSRHKFMATLHQNHLGQSIVFIKGAPEQILLMCHEQRASNGGHESLNNAYWQAQIALIADKGQRVLAFAKAPMKPKKSTLKNADVERGLIFLGMIGLIDPPRPEAISAISQCYLAGIQVKMITGDHSRTAVAIGQQIGIKNTAKVLTGNDLDQMNDETLADAILMTDIFARTSPLHKLRLVIALQSHRMTVAMTGDGVNDAPALKQADAGIAMGKKGSDVAKEAAELILLDDNFASIVAGIREGRTVYDNLKKVISWTLPTSIGEAITIIVALLFGMSLPITAIQILWVNLIAAITLGLIFAFEPTEKNTMQRPPRPRDEPLLNGILIWRITLISILILCGVFGLFLYAIRNGYSEDLASTICLNMLVVMQIFYLFFIRNMHNSSLTWAVAKGNPIVWISVITITTAQFAITYIPFLQKIFTTKAISFADGVLIVVIGVVFFAIIEIEKQFSLYLLRKIS